MSNRLDEKLEAYAEIGESLYMTEGKKRVLKNLQQCSRKRTYVGMRIAFFNLSMVLLALIMIPLTVYAAYQVSPILMEKVKNANYTPEQIEELDKQLKEQHFSEEYIEPLEELNTNSDGLTYGPDVLGADLILVVSDQGEMGYIYRSDYEQADATTLDEAIANPNREVTLTVYDKDGKTKIGTFTLTDGKQKASE